MQGLLSAHLASSLPVTLFSCTELLCSWKSVSFTTRPVTCCLLPAWASPSSWLISPHPSGLGCCSPTHVLPQGHPICIYWCLSLPTLPQIVSSISVDLYVTSLPLSSYASTGHKLYWALDKGLLHKLSESVWRKTEFP